MSSEDIFESWKKNRFIVADYKEIHNGILVVMTDIKYWAENEYDLDLWCREHKCKVKGMTVEIPDEETLLLFTLRWS